MVADSRVLSSLAALNHHYSRPRGAQTDSQSLVCYARSKATPYLCRLRRATIRTCVGPSRSVTSSHITCVLVTGSKRPAGGSPMKRLRGVRRRLSVRTSSGPRSHPTETWSCIGRALSESCFSARQSLPPPTTRCRPALLHDAATSFAHHSPAVPQLKFCGS